MKWQILSLKLHQPLVALFHWSNYKPWPCLLHSLTLVILRLINHLSNLILNQNTILLHQQEYTDLPHDLYIPPEALKVFLDMFEGPLDLLLYLIRKQNLDILQIPIAKITNQYVTYIHAMQVLNIELASEYLLMAAVLLEIKSRILLPRPINSSNEEDDDGLDPRQELIRRLVEYEQIKQASLNLNAMPQAYRDYLWVDVMIEETEAELPTLRPQDLQKAWHTLLLRSLKVQSEHHIKKQELSVREQMSQILRLLREAGKTNFYALFPLQLGVQYIVVNFIAILELGKEGMISIVQDEQRNIFVDLV